MARPPQFSFAFLLLVMIVFCGMCAGLYYAAQVPAIVREVYALFGRPAPAESRASREAHVAFVMFTLTAPLLMAAFLSTLMGILRWWNAERP